MRRILMIVVATLIVFFTQSNAKEPKTVKVDSIVKKDIKIIKNEDGESKLSDSIVYSKLTADQILELKQQEVLVERERIEAESKSEMPLNGFAIVLITLMPFVFVLLIVFMLNKSRNKEAARRYDLYSKSLELGQTLPENFFEKPAKQDAVSNFKRGILWLAIGLALTIYCLVVRELDWLIVGIVPAFVGAGYMIVHFIEKPNKINE